MDEWGSDDEGADMNAIDINLPDVDTKDIVPPGPISISQPSPPPAKPVANVWQQRRETGDVRKFMSQGASSPAPSPSGAVPGRIGLGPASHFKNVPPPASAPPGGRRGYGSGGFGGSNNNPSNNTGGGGGKGVVLYVTNLPHRMEANDLADFFRDAGCRDVRLTYHNDTGNVKAAMVELVPGTNPEQALSYEGRTFGGRPIYVKIEGTGKHRQRNGYGNHNSHGGGGGHWNSGSGYEPAGNGPRENRDRINNNTQFDPTIPTGPAPTGRKKLQLKPRTKPPPKLEIDQRALAEPTKKNSAGASGKKEEATAWKKEPTGPKGNTAATGKRNLGVLAAERSNNKGLSVATMKDSVATVKGVKLHVAPAAPAAPPAAVKTQTPLAPKAEEPAEKTTAPPPKTTPPAPKTSTPTPAAPKTSASPAKQNAQAKGNANAKGPVVAAAAVTGRPGPSPASAPVAERPDLSVPAKGSEKAKVPFSASKARVFVPKSRGAASAHTSTRQQHRSKAQTQPSAPSAPVKNVPVADEDGFVTKPTKSRANRGGNRGRGRGRGYGNRHTNGHRDHRNNSGNGNGNRKNNTSPSPSPSPVPAGTEKKTSGTSEPAATATSAAKNNGESKNAFSALADMPEE